MYNSHSPNRNTKFVQPDRLTSPRINNSDMQQFSFFKCAPSAVKDYHVTLRVNLPSKKQAVWMTFPEVPANDVEQAIRRCMKMVMSHPYYASSVSKIKVNGKDREDL